MGAPGRGGGGFRGQPGGAGPMNMGVRGGMINNPMANMAMNLGVPNMFGMGLPAMGMPGMGGLNGGVGPGGFMGGRGGGGGHQGGFVGRGGGMSSGPRGRGGMNGLGTSF